MAALDLLLPSRRSQRMMHGQRIGFGRGEGGKATETALVAFRL